MTAAITRLASLVPSRLQTLIALPDIPPSPREQTLRTLQLALGQRQRVHLTYETASRGGEVTERDFDPYAIFPYGRSWHIIGHCHLRDAIRDFKADRIAAVAPRVMELSLPCQAAATMSNSRRGDASSCRRLAPSASRSRR